MGLPEGKLLAIDMVSQNRLNAIKSHTIKLKLKENLCFGKPYLTTLSPIQ